MVQAMTALALVWNLSASAVAPAALVPLGTHDYAELLGISLAHTTTQLSFRRSPKISFVSAISATGTK
jgi:hypothetical protein